jgi:monooxygenase
VLSTATGETDVIGLLRDGRPLLLLLGEEGSGHQEAAREWEGKLYVVRARPTPEVPHDALLVRPDGYIAWASGDGCDLTDALSAHFVKGVVPKSAVPEGTVSVGHP